MYSFLHSQMGKSLFLEEKKIQILANLCENAIRRVIVTPFPYSCTSLLLNNDIC